MSKKERPSKQVIVNVTNNINNENKAISSNTNSNTNYNLGLSTYKFFTFFLLAILFVSFLLWVFNFTSDSEEKPGYYNGKYNFIRQIKKDDWPVREINNWILTDIVVVDGGIYGLYAPKSERIGIDYVVIGSIEKLIRFAQENQYRVTRVIENGDHYILLARASKFKSTAYASNLYDGNFNKLVKNLYQRGYKLDYNFHDRHAGKVGFFSKSNCSKWSIGFNQSISNIKDAKLLDKKGYFLEDYHCNNDNKCYSIYADSPCRWDYLGSYYRYRKFSGRIGWSDLIKMVEQSDSLKRSVIKLFYDNSSFLAFEEERE